MYTYHICSYVVKLIDQNKKLVLTIHTVLPRITAWAFISFKWFLTRPLNETDDYYRKKHVLFIICDASDEF